MICINTSARPWSTIVDEAQAAYHEGEVKLVLGLELRCKPLHLAARVAKDDGLGLGDGLAELPQRIEFPLLVGDGNVELPNACVELQRNKECEK
jgi:hypothetical protein